MKTLIAFGCGLLFLAAWASAGQVNESTVLAEWDGGNITVGEYTHWWERLSPDARPDLSTMEGKVDFLENMINAKVMLAEAEAMGVPEHPNVTNWVHSRRVNAIRERLYQEAVKGRLEVDEAEVRKIYEKRLAQINASHIVVPTYGKALAILDSLNAGVAFEDLAENHSTCASGANGACWRVRSGSSRWTPPDAVSSSAINASSGLAAASSRPAYRAVRRVRSSTRRWRKWCPRSVRPVCCALNIL